MSASPAAAARCLAAATSFSQAIKDAQCFSAERRKRGGDPLNLLAVKRLRSDSTTAMT